MTEWGVFGVIGALISFGLLVGTPLMKLNASITKLSALVEFMQKQLDTFKTDNDKEHNSIWNEMERHEDTLGDHETRISVLEHK
jgi:hypothetical protein